MQCSPARRASKNAISLASPSSCCTRQDSSGLNEAGSPPAQKSYFTLLHSPRQPLELIHASTLSTRRGGTRFGRDFGPSWQQVPQFPGSTKIEFSFSTGHPSLFRRPRTPLLPSAPRPTWRLPRRSHYLRSDVGSEIGGRHWSLMGKSSEWLAYRDQNRISKTRAKTRRHHHWED